MTACGAWLSTEKVISSHKEAQVQLPLIPASVVSLIHPRIRTKIYVTKTDYGRTPERGFTLAHWMYICIYIFSSAWIMVQGMNITGKFLKYNRGYNAFSLRACPEEERVASVSVSLLYFLYTYIYVFVPVP